MPRLLRALGAPAPSRTVPPRDGSRSDLNAGARTNELAAGSVASLLRAIGDVAPPRHAGPRVATVNVCAKTIMSASLGGNLRTIPVAVRLYALSTRSIHAPLDTQAGTSPSGTGTCHAGPSQAQSAECARQFAGFSLRLLLWQIAPPTMWRVAS